MQIRRIVIDLNFGRRVILYPEGGMDLEAEVPGVGWVLDNDAYVPEPDLAGVLVAAAEVAMEQARNVAPHIR